MSVVTDVEFNMEPDLRTVHVGSVVIFYAQSVAQRETKLPLSVVDVIFTVQFVSF